MQTSLSERDSERNEKYGSRYIADGMTWVSRGVVRQILMFHAT